MQNKKGFTIIELIVVVAIIAVLAAIVSINVVTYLKKGKDAAIKSNLNTAQTAMVALVDSTAGIVATSCSDTGDLKNSYQAAATISGAESCADVAGAACACAQMINNTATYMCVDSIGNKLVDSAVACSTDCVEATDTTCDGL